jgi:hypothetical protein
MLRTITLATPLTFAEALQQLLDGKCLGIRPGANTRYVEMFKPGWMNPNSPDFMLRWHGSDDDASIRSNQYLETWFPVIVDHRALASPAAVAA